MFWRASQSLASLAPAAFPVITALITMCLLITSGSALAQSSSRVTSLKEIRERGVIMQRWETSCAGAALATVFTYGHGDAVSELQVVSAMLEKTDPARVKERGGFSMLDMKRYVEGRGYKAFAYRGLSLDDLRVMQAPIVPIDARGANHYVVFNGIDGDEVRLADPMFGNRRMHKDRFAEIWLQGTALLVSR